MDVLRQVAAFIEVDADDELLQGIASQTTFEKMKEGKIDDEWARLEPYFVKGYSMYRKGKFYFPLHV